MGKVVAVGLSLFYITYLPVSFAAVARAVVPAISAKEVQRESRIILDEDITGQPPERLRIKYCLALSQLVLMSMYPVCGMALEPIILLRCRPRTRE